MVLFAGKDLLAGDLEAWLSGAFMVVRVGRLPDAMRELEQRPHAVVLVLDEMTDQEPILSDVSVRLGTENCRILVLGGQPSACPAAIRGKVTFLPAYPDPRRLLSALQGPSARSGEA